MDGIRPVLYGFSQWTVNSGQWGRGGRESIVGVPRLKGHKGSLLQTRSATYWTSEFRTSVNESWFCQGAVTFCSPLTSTAFLFIQDKLAYVCIILLINSINFILKESAGSNNNSHKMISKVFGGVFQILKNTMLSLTFFLTATNYAR